MKEYIQNFLRYLIVEKGFSKNTEEAYRNDLSQLESFINETCGKNGTMPCWESFGRPEMLAYMLSLKEKKYASTTLARKVAERYYRP